MLKNSFGTWDTNNTKDNDSNVLLDSKPKQCSG